MRLKEIAYKSGDAFFPTKVRLALYRYIIGDDHSLLYINYWSIIHLLSGMAIAFMTKNMMTALLVHTIWELWQRAIGMTVWNLRGSIDTLVDTGIFMLGYLLMSRYYMVIQG